MFMVFKYIYYVVEKHRKSTCGRGVAIYVKHGIDYFYREDLSGFDDCMESVFIEIPKDVFKLGKNVIIGTIYRPPGTDITQFNKKLEAVVVKIQKENKKCYIMGDYNMNLLNYDVHYNTAEFTDMMYANSFIPLVTRPTRITQSSATLIDNIFTNDLENLATSMQGILVADITDHFPVAYINTKYSNLEKEITVLKRVSTARNRTLFLNAISNLDWSDIYSSSDTQSAYSITTIRYSSCTGSLFEVLRLIRDLVFSDSPVIVISTLLKTCDYSGSLGRTSCAIMLLTSHLPSHIFKIPWTNRSL